MKVRVKTYYLEMRQESELQEKVGERDDMEIKREEAALPERLRFFYTAVGGEWYWVDRLGWSYKQWQEYANRPGLEVWAAYVRGMPAGYYVLEGEAGRDVEIAYFGLLPQFVGQGLGGHLLTEAVRRAWQKGAKRVWVHTCSLDHPRALANYQKRGFRQYRTEEAEKELSSWPAGPWPGANKEKG